MKIPKKDQQTLLEKFKARPAAPSQPNRGEIDFTKQLEKNGDKVEATLRADKGTITDGTAYEFLKAEGLNPEEWEITGFRKSQWSGFNGEDMESVRFNFKKISNEGTIVLPDLDDLHKAIKTSKTKGKPKSKSFNVKTIVGCLADPQVGKVDREGGSQELLERLEISLDRWVAYLEKYKPQEVILADGGDGPENFQNVASQSQTNDLRLTEQLRVLRRIWWSTLDVTASLVPSVKMASVPSNHARIRQGKNVLSEPFDDYGIEMLCQLHDMAQVYPEKYSHVSFYTPDDFEDTLAIQTLDGTVIGLAHGDQVNSQNALPNWLAGQALANSPVGNCDILVSGHFHNLRITTVGNNRTIFTAPANDGGSSWYTNKTGNSSATGILGFVVDKNEPIGWTGLEVL